MRNLQKKNEQEFLKLMVKEAANHAMDEVSIEKFDYLSIFYFNDKVFEISI